MSDEKQQQLRTLRDQLLRIHTALLADQRKVYEDMYGKVRTSGEMLNLVMSHEWFSWLRALSSLIVEMDVLMASKDSADAQGTTLIEYTKALLVPAEEGANFRIKYHQAVQREPAVLIEHGRLKKLLESFSTEAVP